MSEQLPEGYRFRIGWARDIGFERHRYVRLQRRVWGFWVPAGSMYPVEADGLDAAKWDLWEKHQADRQWKRRTETTL